MASEGDPPPPNNASFEYPPNTNNPPVPQSYPSQTLCPPAAPPSYSSHDWSQAYPVQTGAPPFLPEYSVDGAAPGYTTQAVGVNNYPNTQTAVITQQPTGGVIIHAAAPPPDYMEVSIISILFCPCIGVFAVLKSVRSRNLFRAGDHDGAQAMGLHAKKLAHNALSFAICIFSILSIIVIVLRSAKK